MRIQLSLIIFIVFLTSCKKKFNNDHLKIFKYNESAGIQSLDPAFSKDQASVCKAIEEFSQAVCASVQRRAMTYCFHFCRKG